MGILLITDDDEQAIKAIVAKARANFVPWSTLSQHTVINDPDAPITLKDRRADAPPRPQSQHIQLGDYMAAFSFEEQPAGMIRHLSVSCINPTTAPNPVAVATIATAFGFDRAASMQSWLEEFSPGHYAGNLVQIAEPAENLDKPQ